MSTYELYAGPRDGARVQIFDSPPPEHIFVSGDRQHDIETFGTGETYVAWSPIGTVTYHVAYIRNRKCYIHKPRPSFK